MRAAARPPRAAARRRRCGVHVACVPVAVIRFLSNLTSGEGGKQLEERDVIEWANAKVGDTAPPIGSLKDASLGTGRFLLALLRAVEPRSVDSAQVKEGATAEEKMLNAKYAISCARRMGAMVFMLWEDITEVRPKMILVFLATVMSLPGALKAD